MGCFILRWTLHLYVQLKSPHLVIDIRFSSLNTEILGVSVDSKHRYLAWIQTPRNEGGTGDINYPLVSDESTQHTMFLMMMERLIEFIPHKSEGIVMHPC